MCAGVFMKKSQEEYLTEPKHRYLLAKEPFASNFIGGTLMRVEKVWRRTSVL
jgi:hypothetical protein